MGNNLDTLLQKLEKLDDERTHDWYIDGNEIRVDLDPYCTESGISDCTIQICEFYEHKRKEASLIIEAVNSNKVLREVIRIQREALRDTIARAEDCADSWIHKPAREGLEAVEKLIGEGRE